MTKTYKSLQDYKEGWSVSSTIKTIEFCKVSYEGNVGSVYKHPSAYDHIVLLYKANGMEEYDEMIAWNDEKPHIISHYFGHWNSGVA